MKNALGEAYSESSSGPQPGQRWPSMGKPAYGPTPAAKAPEGNPPPAAQQYPDQAPSPPTFRAKAPAFDTGAMQQRKGSPATGPTQRDGTQSPEPKQPPPVRKAQIEARSLNSPTHKASGMDSALSALADKMHPIKAKRR